MSWATVLARCNTGHHRGSTLIFPIERSEKMSTKYLGHQCYILSACVVTTGYKTFLGRDKTRRRIRMADEKIRMRKCGWGIKCG